MRVATASILCLALGLWAGPICAADDPKLNAAYQDHIAYIATFSLPVLIEKCIALQPDYLQKAAPLYFRYINTHQDQIERGRMLTLAELPPDETVKAYRESVIASRLSKLDSGTREEKLVMCERALGMLSGNKLPGEWPARPSPADQAH
jgi:hypothetical protein